MQVSNFEVIRFVYLFILHDKYKVCLNLVTVWFVDARSRIGCRGENQRLNILDRAHFFVETIFQSVYILVDVLGGYQSDGTSSPSSTGESRSKCQLPG